MEVIIATVITVVGGGIFGLVNHLFNKKTEDAKLAVSKNTAQVEATNSVLKNMDLLLTNYRIEDDRKEKKIESLEQELEEERALNRSLISKLEEKLDDSEE